MSIKLSSFVWNGCAASGLKITAVAIMARLADFSSDDGLSWPSVNTLARQIGASESTVRATLKFLEQEGWLSSKPRRHGNRNGSNTYQLNIFKLESTANINNCHPTDSEGPNFAQSELHPSVIQSDDRFDPPKSIEDPLKNSKNDPSNSKIPLSPKIETVLPLSTLRLLAQRVLDHFNEHTNSSFLPNRTNLKLLINRLIEYSEEEVVLVIDFNTARWLKDPRMCDFLRPKTILNSEKFSDYLVLANKWKISGRPENGDGKWLMSDRKVADTSERDAAYRRFISGVQTDQPISDLEKQVRRVASKSGINKMRTDTAVTTWVRIWKECFENS